VSRAVLTGATVVVAGCTVTRPDVSPRDPPDLAPAPEARTTQIQSQLTVEIEPILRETLTVDLPAVVRTTLAQDIDVLQARLEVEAAMGRLESARAQWVPVLSPVPALYEIVDGNVRATPGNLVDVGFNTLRTFIGAELIVNPGRVYYEGVAASKRLLQAAHQEQAVVLGSLRDGAVQYYSLVLAQARVAAGRQSLLEAGEFLRITRVRVEQGMGVEADRLRAEARLAERTQDLVSAMDSYHRASVALATTLRLDPTITLIPAERELSLRTLVREDLGIPELLELAAQYRADLAAVRQRVEVVEAERSALAWGGFGPTLEAAYQVGGIGGHADDPEGDYGLRFQQRFVAAAGWRLRLATLGDLKAADAVGQQTRLEAERVLDRVRGQVVVAAVSARTFKELVGLTAQQVDSAEAALRLVEAGLAAGTATTLDVLEAGTAVAEGRLRRARAVVGYDQAQVDLLAAVGLLDERSLVGDDPGD
jgi:outer membrane protein TolC